MADEYSELMRPWHNGTKAPDAQNGVPQTDFDELAIVANAGHDSEQKALHSFGLAHQVMEQELRRKLLAHIHSQTFGFFEQLMIDVVSLAFGNKNASFAQKLGRSGDGGVDGVIELDELGLDLVYLQGKRLKPSTSVSASAVRDFLGSLETKHATKGVFVTTGSFTHQATAAIASSSRRVALISGERLTQIMLRHGVGIKSLDMFRTQTIDLGYFGTRNQ